ncbi:MAG: putative glycoside hydrolase [Gaiellaceae bacterium]
MQVAGEIGYTEARARQRELRRRQVRRRRLVASSVLAVLGAAAVFGLVQLATGSASARAVTLRPVASAALPASRFRAALPDELRGVHVTMDLASLPGKFAQYLALKKDGLNAIELDVKDENGNVAFVRGAPALAVKDGAARQFYSPQKAARETRKAGIYLIGRVVSFEDPITSVAEPSFAIHTSDGSVWKNAGGLGWLNPYSHAAWKYDVDIAVAAAKAGFDEIQFDYVRFPSDGNTAAIRYPGAHAQPMNQTVAAFLRYAVTRLHPLGVRVSADVFGLSATHDLGIGQFPGQVGEVVDAIYPMTYPSHYTAGEFNLPDPNAAPGATVGDSLRDFVAQTAGARTMLVPWLQDFSLGRTYTPADVAAQVAAARLYHTGGFMLWNASGLYTAQELRAGPPPPLPDLTPPGL